MSCTLHLGVTCFGPVNREATRDTANSPDLVHSHSVTLVGSQGTVYSLSHIGHVASCLRTKVPSFVFTSFLRLLQFNSFSKSFRTMSLTV